MGSENGFVRVFEHEICAFDAKSREPACLGGVAPS
jgi:hypothetical protein